MQFSDITNYQGIVQMIERESKLGLGVISDNDAPDYWKTYFLGKINEWNHIVNIWIREVNDEWIHDDINNTGDIPEELNFTDNIQIYDLDSDIVKIRKVEAKDAVSLDWYTLDYYYQSNRVENLYGQSKGLPSKYFLQGRQLIIDVPIDIAKSTKYRLTYDRHAHDFVIEDTTAVPGFDKQLHWILVYAPVMDWASGRYPDIYNICRGKVFGAGEGDPQSLKFMIQDFYQKQNRDAKYLLKRKTHSYA